MNIIGIHLITEHCDSTSLEKLWQIVKKISFIWEDVRSKNEIQEPACGLKNRELPGECLQF